MLVEGGALADTLGRIVGVGPGRGIAVMFLATALLTIVVVLIASLNRAFRGVEDPSVANAPVTLLPPATSPHDQSDDLDSKYSCSPFVALAAMFAVVVVIVVRAPSAVPSSAPPEHFASGRAMEVLRSIASEPRPLGSAGNRRALDNILNHLKALGVEASVESVRRCAVRDPPASTPGRYETSSP